MTRPGRCEARFVLMPVRIVRGLFDHIVRVLLMIHDEAYGNGLHVVRASHQPGAWLQRLITTLAACDMLRAGKRKDVAVFGCVQEVIALQDRDRTILLSDGDTRNKIAIHGDGCWTSSRNKQKAPG